MKILLFGWILTTFLHKSHEKRSHLKIIKFSGRKIRMSFILDQMKVERVRLWSWHLLHLKYRSDNFNMFLQLISINKIYVHQAFRVLRAHLLFYLITFSLCIHCKTKKQKIRGFYKKNSSIFKVFKDRILLEASFWKFNQP